MVEIEEMKFEMEGIKIKKQSIENIKLIQPAQSQFNL
jgi:hypothetical protein